MVFYLRKQLDEVHFVTLVIDGGGSSAMEFEYVKVRFVADERFTVRSLAIGTKELAWIFPPSRQPVA